MTPSEFETYKTIFQLEITCDEQGVPERLTTGLFDEAYALFRQGRLGAPLATKIQLISNILESHLKGGRKRFD